MELKSFINGFILSSAGQPKIKIAFFLIIELKILIMAAISLKNNIFNCFECRYSRPEICINKI